jgi:hypothetical protein
MAVSTSKPKGIHTRPSHLGLRPRTILPNNVEVPLVKFDAGVDVLDTNGGGDLSALEGES